MRRRAVLLEGPAGLVVVGGVDVGDPLEEGWQDRAGVVVLVDVGALRHEDRPDHPPFGARSINVDGVGWSVLLPEWSWVLPLEAVLLLVVGVRHVLRGDLGGVGEAYVVPPVGAVPPVLVDERLPLLHVADLDEGTGLWHTPGVAGGSDPSLSGGESDLFLVVVVGIPPADGDSETGAAVAVVVLVDLADNRGDEEPLADVTDGAAARTATAEGDGDTRCCTETLHILAVAGDALRSEAPSDDVAADVAVSVVLEDLEHSGPLFDVGRAVILLNATEDPCRRHRWLDQKILKQKEKKSILKKNQF